MTFSRAFFVLAIACASSCGPAAELNGTLAVDSDAGLTARGDPLDGSIRQRLYDGGPGGSDCPNVSLTSIRERVFLTRCGGSRCHASDQPAMGLDLSLEVAELSPRLREKSMETLQGLPLIKPNAYGSSYLYLKIFFATPTEGEQMPPTAPLDQCTLDSFKDWIQLGAPD